MVVEAARRGAGRLGAEIAAVVVEHGLGGDSTDLSDRLERWRRERSPRAEAARTLAQAFWRGVAGLETEPAGAPPDPGVILALGFPERIGKARGRPGEVLMANGRAASLEPHDRLAREPFLAIGEVAGRAGGARILLAAPLAVDAIELLAGDAIVVTDAVTFDMARAALSRRETSRLGSLVLAERNLPVPGDLAAAEVLARGVAALGLARLPWSKAQTQWRDRVGFLRRAEGATSEWPDLSDEALARTAATWLAPFILGRTSLQAITAEDLGAALDALVPFGLARRLDAEAPTHFTAPTGSRVAVDYDAEGGPVLAIRVQELFGLREHPALARGRVPLTLHLLSPAHRPIQITTDLPGFWRGSWTAVKAEMRGRYPRHPWPDDPAAAPPTARAKPRGT